MTDDHQLSYAACAALPCCRSHVTCTCGLDTGCICTVDALVVAVDHGVEIEQERATRRREARERETDALERLMKEPPVSRASRGHGGRRHITGGQR